MFDLKDKVALVTGGTRGIGLGYVKELLQNEIKGVALIASNATTGQKALEEVTAAFGKGRAIFIKCDVTDRAQLEDVWVLWASYFNRSNPNNAPDSVTNRNALNILKSAFSYTKTLDPKPQKFHLGVHVRISKYRAAFAKGYTPSWSNEIFKIAKVRLTNPTTYILEDDTHQHIKGTFYEYELQKTKHPDTFLAEKVIRKKGNQLFVKWLGFDTTHNSWIPKTNLV